MLKEKMLKASLIISRLFFARPKRLLFGVILMLLLTGGTTSAEIITATDPFIRSTEEGVYGFIRQAEYVHANQVHIYLPSPTEMINVRNGGDDRTVRQIAYARSKGLSVAMTSTLFTYGDYWLPEVANQFFSDIEYAFGKYDIDEFECEECNSPSLSAEFNTSIFSRLRTIIDAKKASGDLSPDFKLGMSSTVNSITDLIARGDVETAKIIDYYRTELATQDSNAVQYKVNLLKPYMPNTEIRVVAYVQYTGIKTDCKKNGYDGYNHYSCYNQAVFKHIDDAHKTGVDFAIFTVYDPGTSRYYFPNLPYPGAYASDIIRGILNSTTASAPSFSPSSNTFSSPQSVTLSSATAGAAIHYTLDNTIPTESSPAYTAPILVSSTTTIKAGAWKTGLTPSSIVTAVYTIYTPILTSIDVSPSTASIVKNSTQTFTAAPKDQNNNPMTGINITWSSSNPSIASINSSGLVTALFEGSAVITASGGTKSGTASVTVALTQTNLILNPSFESGTASWSFYTNGTGTFTSSSPANTGTNSAKLSLVTVPATPNIQLYQSNISLEPNTKYRLTFSAYSSTGHDLKVNLLKNVSPYTIYGLANYTPNLTSSWQVFTKDFTTSGFTGTVNDARLQIWLASHAQTGDIYYIDDVKIEKVMIDTDTIPPVISISSPLSNQTFTVSPITISGTASDSGSDVKTVQYRINSGSWQNAIGTTSWSASVPLIAGSNTIDTQAIDNAVPGNVSLISSVTVAYESGVAFSISQFPKRVAYTPIYGVGTLPSKAVMKRVIDEAKAALSDGLEFPVVPWKDHSALINVSIADDPYAYAIDYANSLGMKTILNYAPTKINGCVNNTCTRVDPAIKSVHDNIISDFTFYVNRYGDRAGLIGFDLEEPEYFVTPTDGGAAFRDTLNNLFTELRNIEKTKFPNLLLSINCSTNNSASYAKFGIDTKYILQNNLIDYYSIQTTTHVGSWVNGVWVADTYPTTYGTYPFKLWTEFKDTIWPGMPTVPYIYYDSSNIKNSKPCLDQGKCINTGFFEQVKDLTNRGIPVNIFSNKYYEGIPTYFATSTGTKFITSIPGNTTMEKLANIPIPVSSSAVTSNIPASNAINIPAAQTITVTFNEAVQSSAGYGSITLKDSNNIIIGVTKTLNTNTLTIDPSSDLDYSKTYTVSIPAGAVKDFNNIDIANAYTFSFTTQALPVLTTFTVSPASASLSVNSTQTLTVTAKDQFNNPMTVPIDWTSSVPAVASVNPSGLVTALSAGTSTITASSGAKSAVSVITVTPASANLLQNPGFESGTSSWLFYTNGTGSFTAGSPAYAGLNAAKLSLSSTGSNIQLYQTGMTLESNTKYRFSFQAYSSTGHDLNANLIQTTTGNSYGLNQSFNLTTAWQPHTIDFTTSGFTGSATDGRLMFPLGSYAQAGDVYYIDDIKLEKVTNSDTTPPIISAVSSSSITSTGATVAWTTNEASDSQIEYGTTTSYGTSTTLNANLVTSHSQSLAGLTSSTLYHYRVKSKDAAGNLATSVDNIFTTLASAPSSPQNLTSQAGDSSVSLSWLIPSSDGGSPITGYKVYRGTSSNSEIFLANSSSLSYTDNSVTNNTIYYYQITAINSIGESSRSGETMANPQMTKIQGTISDSSNLPISGATVTDGTRSAMTDSQGSYILNSPAGSYTLTVSKTGYLSQSKPATVIAGQTTTVNFSLSVFASINADLNSDNLVNSADFGMLMSAWGNTTKPKADINQDGIVNSVDFGIMMSQWG